MRSSMVLLPAPFGPMIDAQFAFIHVEVQIGDGFEAIERLVHAFERQDELLWCGHSILASVLDGRTPCGRLAARFGRGFGLRPQ